MPQMENAQPSGTISFAYLAEIFPMLPPAKPFVPSAATNDRTLRPRSTRDGGSGASAPPASMYPTAFASAPFWPLPIDCCASKMRGDALPAGPRPAKCGASRRPPWTSH